MDDVRLIDANALLKSFDVAKMVEYDETGCGVTRKAIPVQTIKDAPTIDAVPVVHGRWVKAHGMMPPEYHHRKQCSMCGGWALQDYFGRERMSHYCPNCGAKMDGGAEDENT